jgi:hypothetical protein
MASWRSLKQRLERVPQGSARNWFEANAHLIIARRGRIQRSATLESQRSATLEESHENRGREQSDLCPPAVMFGGRNY